MKIDQTLRGKISDAVCAALEPLPAILAGWEGGSAAFDAVDEYSDIDLTFLVDDDAATNLLYEAAERSLETISPIAASHPAPPGRYYKLKNVDEFLLVDLCFLRAGAPDHFLEIERHGHIIPFFDKGDWLRPRPLDEDAAAAGREKRFKELETWFPISQIFVLKAILRGQHAEAMTCYWAYTMRPLAELLRMRHCPVRWDFGLRYLDRDLPPSATAQIRELALVRDLQDLEAKLAKAKAWGVALLEELNWRQRQGHPGV